MDADVTGYLLPVESRAEIDLQFRGHTENLNGFMSRDVANELTVSPADGV
jgi:hypothetical protein